MHSRDYSWQAWAACDSQHRMGHKRVLDWIVPKWFRPLDSENAAMLTSPLAVHESLLFIPKKHFACQPWCAGCLCWIWRSCTELHGIFTVKVRYCTHVIKNVMKMQFIVYFNTWIWYVSFPITPINAKAMNAFLLSEASSTAILKNSSFHPQLQKASIDIIQC